MRGECDSSWRTRAARSASGTRRAVSRPMRRRSSAPVMGVSSNASVAPSPTSTSRRSPSHRRLRPVTLIGKKTIFIRRGRRRTRERRSRRGRRRLPQPDQLHRQPEVLLDREHDAALGRAVELGQHHAGHLHCLGELACLREAVLASCRVDDQQHLAHMPRRAVGHTSNLAELLHEVDLGVETARGVGEHEVGTPRRGALHAIEDHRARVAALGSAHEVSTDSLGPLLELFGGGGTERVASGHHDRVTVRDLACADLADRRRLPHAVDAHEEPHARLAGSRSSTRLRSTPSSCSNMSTFSASSTSSGVVSPSALTCARRSSMRSVVNETPTSARSSASSRSSHVSSVMLPRARTDANAPASARGPCRADRETEAGARTSSSTSTSTSLDNPGLGEIRGGPLRLEHLGRRLLHRLGRRPRPFEAEAPLSPAVDDDHAEPEEHDDDREDQEEHVPANLSGADLSRD